MNRRTALKALGGAALTASGGFPHIARAQNRRPNILS
jgi:hypothetical protein